MNLYQRHGDTLMIAMAVDFNGNRWTTNAVIHQVPRGVSYLLPVGAVMRLFKRYNGSHGITVIRAGQSGSGRQPLWQRISPARRKHEQGEAESSRDWPRLLQRSGKWY